jgi:hypothetical protein
MAEMRGTLPARLMLLDLRQNTEVGFKNEATDIYCV